MEQSRIQEIQNQEVGASLDFYANYLNPNESMFKLKDGIHISDWSKSYRKFLRGAGRKENILNVLTASLFKGLIVENPKYNKYADKSLDASLCGFVREVEAVVNYTLIYYKGLFEQKGLI